MNVLWINHRDPLHPQTGGAEVRIYEVGKRLVRDGHNVKLICEQWNGSKNYDNLDGIEIHRIAGKKLIHLKAPLFIRKFDNSDIIIDDIAHAVPWGSQFFTKTCVIGQVHHVHKEVLNYELNPFWAKIVALSESTIKYSYKNLITVSESTKHALNQKFGIPENRITVIPNGVDIDFYKPSIKNSLPTILWVGRVKRYKRVEHVLSAFKLVKKNIPKSQLIIVGDGDYLEDLKKITKRLKISNVTFMGSVSDEEKASLMASSWVTVSASLIEGWGMTISESAACGTPAVAYDVPGLRDSIKDGQTGLLVKSGDIPNLSESLIKMLNYPDLRQKLSQNALIYSRNYNWDNITAQFISFFENLIKKSHE